MAATRDATPASHRQPARSARRRRYEHAGIVPDGGGRAASVQYARRAMWHRTTRWSRCKVFNGM
ncbi:hypothetical protein WS54_28590 [Burkholderia sp. NRF60-BP8]|nr:hypothetical protein WS54_28590 [Burkholderia sp. NRF60-BP8]